jgi:hypothetical protein
MYKIIHMPNLPQIPKELLKYTYNMENSFHSSKAGRVMKRNGETFIEGFNSREDVNEDLIPWLKENIINDWGNIGYHRFKGPNCGPHLDRCRHYVLNYIIETGGSQVSSIFWKPKSEQLDITHHDSRVDDYDQLTIDEVFILQPNQWYIINGRAGIHSVENIENTRVSLQIGFWHDPLTKIIKFS